MKSLNKQTTKKLTMMQRVDGFLGEIVAEFAPESRGHLLITEYQTQLAALDAALTTKYSGSTSYSASIESKTEIREDLVEHLRLFRDAAEVLESDHPDIGQRYAFNERLSEVALLKLAQQIAASAGVDRPLLSELLEDEVLDALPTRIAAFEAVLYKRDDGLGERIRGNALLGSQLDELSRKVRRLDRLMKIHLRERPGMLAEWQRTKRIRQTGPSAPAESSPATMAG